MKTGNGWRSWGAVLGLATALLAACAPIEGRETAGQYVDDATISTKVRAQLIGDQSLKAFDIHVETMQGTVQLSGFVDADAQKTQAQRIASGVSGVHGVRNDIVVRGH
jgi:osmotically-inducible protein OsmY